MIHMVQKKYNIESEIILLLLRGENHLRGIAKQLNVPHSTILRRLNVLANDSILDYRTEGKNKVFCIKRNLQAKNFVFNAERYKLIKLLKTYPSLNIIVDDILKRCKERLVVLFGSYANFAATKDSDIDVYIETKYRGAKDDIEMVNSRIRAKIGSFDLDSLLMKEIIKNHVILRGVEDFYEKTRFFE